MSLLGKCPHYVFLYVLCSFVFFTSVVEAKIKVLETSSDQTVYVIREKPILENIDSPTKGMLVAAKPLDACGPVTPPPSFFPVEANNSVEENGTLSSFNDDFAWILLVSWGAIDKCSIRVKAENAEAAGYSVMLLQDPSLFLEENDSSAESDPLRAFMSPLGLDSGASSRSFTFEYPEDGIYACTINPEDWDVLRSNFTNESYYLSFENSNSMNGWFTYFIVGILVIGAVFFTIGLTYVLVQLLVLILLWIRESIVSRIQQARRDRRRRLPASQLKKIPVQQWNSDMLQDICSICLETFVVTDRVRILPCSHVFHQICIDPWLLKQRRKCPNCKRKIAFPDENREMDSSSDDERTPLLRRSSSSISRDSRSASAGASPGHSRSQPHEQHQTQLQHAGQSQSAPEPQCISNLHRFLVLGIASNNPILQNETSNSQPDERASTSSAEPSSIDHQIHSGSQAIKEKVDLLCARMENVGRKIKKKAKQGQPMKQETNNTATDSSSDMSTSIQQVLVSVAVEPARSAGNDEGDNGIPDLSNHDTDAESQNSCKSDHTSSSNANLNGNSSTSLSSQSNDVSKPVTNLKRDNDLEVQVKVVPESSPCHNSLSCENSNEKDEESSISSDLNA